MSRVSRRLQQRGSTWIGLLEVLVRGLNLVLLVLGSAVLAWAIYTGVLIQHSDSVPPQPPPSALLASSGAHPTATTHYTSSASNSSSSNTIRCPWFVPAIGAVGAATALTALLAISASCMRSVSCMTAHIFVMSGTLTAQTAVAAGLYMDKTWEDRLPEEEEHIKQWLAGRLEVCKWVGVGLACLQLVTLMSSCLLHGAYNSVDEAAEEEDEEAAARTAPLLRAQQAGVDPAVVRTAQQHYSRSTAAAAARATMPASETTRWAAHMREQYNLDPSQFGAGRARQQQGAGVEAQQPGGRSCSIM